MQVEMEQGREVMEVRDQDQEGDRFLTHRSYWYLQISPYPQRPPAAEGIILISTTQPSLCWVIDWAFCLICFILLICNTFFLNAEHLIIIKKIFTKKIFTAHQSAQVDMKIQSKIYIYIWFFLDNIKTAIKYFSLQSMVTPC